jgi:hypothetical protein
VWDQAPENPQINPPHLLLVVLEWQPLATSYGCLYHSD